MWGVAKSPGGISRQLQSWESVRKAWKQEEAVLWLDLEKPTAEQLKHLQPLVAFDDQSLKDLLAGEPRPRIEEYDDYLLVIAYGVIVPEGQIELESRKLAIFRGSRFLITIHMEPSRSVAAMKQRCEKNADTVLDQGIDQVFFRLIDGMVDRYLTLLDDYEEELEDYEERSFELGPSEEFLQDALRIRRHFIEIRRLAAAQRGLLAPLAEGDFDYLSAELSRKFRTVENHLLHAVDRVDGLQERLNAAIQNYNAALSKRTNEIVRTLTVLTAVVLPMSLIAGIYGMNLPGWPPGNSEASFWGVVAFMAVCGGAMIGVFRWLRWI
jgi:magnesium transporter